MVKFRSKIDYQKVMPLLSVSGKTGLDEKSLQAQNKYCSTQFFPNPYGSQESGIARTDFPSTVSIDQNTYVRRTDTDNNHRHIPVFVGGNRSCLFCSKNKVRTKNGWYVYSSYKCGLCDVILCTGRRNCFQLYHAAMGISLSTTDS